MCWKSSMSCHRHLNIKYLHVWKSETNWLTYYISFFAFKIRLWTISLWVGILDAHIFPHDTCAIKDFGGAAFLEFSTQKAGFLDVGNIVSWFRCWYPGMYSICVNSLSLLLFSFLVVSDSLWPQGLQHARLPCLSLPPRVCSNSCPLSQGCHPTISSSVVPFSSCLQPFPASESFLTSWLFASSDQSIGASASASVLPMNIQTCFPSTLN